MNQPRPSKAKFSFQPEVYFSRDWHGSGNRFARWDDAKAFVDDLARNWNPRGFIKGTIIRRVNEPPNAYWDRTTKQAERFDEANVIDNDGRAA
jgi:hypothetical protein